MPQLKVGQKVAVYFDPLTEKEPEGVATLKVYRYSGGTFNGRPIEWWTIRFTDGTLGFRKILVKGDSNE